MSTIQLAASATAANSGTFDAAAYHSVTFFATGLAGAEEVDVMIGGGSVPVVAIDAAGNPVKLTATKPSAVLEGGPYYILQKDATAAAATMYAAPRLS